MTTGLLAFTTALALDPVRFVRECLGFHLDARQAEILALQSFRLLLNCTRQWGKSTLAAAMAVHHAIFHPGSLTIVLSPTARQSAEFLRKAEGFVRRLGITPRGDGHNEISILLPNGSRIVGLPGNEDTIRGFSGVSLPLIDEAARVPDELYDAVRPMLATANGRLILMSTPNGRRGFFWNEWTNHPERWDRFAITVAECPRISKEFADQELATMGRKMFGQEYLCEFGDAADLVFSRDWTDRAQRDDVDPLLIEASFVRPNLGADFFIGVDLGKQRDHAAVIAIERHQTLTGKIDRVTYEREFKTRYRVRYVEQLPLKTTYPDIVTRVLAVTKAPEINNRHCTLVVDATGVGGPFVDMLRKERLEVGLVPVTITGAERESNGSGGWRVPKSNLIQNLELQFEREELVFSKRMAGLDALLNELHNFQRDASGPGHDDLVLALSLAAWRARPPR